MALGLSTPNITSQVRHLARQLRQGVRDRLRGETRETLFDFHDLAGLNDLLRLGDAGEFPAIAADAETGRIAAIRSILSPLLTNPKLRRKFPTALTDGPAGSFAKSFAADRSLSEVARSNIHEAFESDPSSSVKRVYELRDDLRRAYPLGLTPRQRGLYLHWLLEYGRHDLGVVPEAALWFLMEQDETPDRGLIATYRLQPEWQAAVPHGLTRFGWNQLKSWVKSHYRFDCRWINRATLPDQFRPWDELVQLFQVDSDLRKSLPADTNELVAWATRTPRVAKFVDRDWLARLAEDVRDRLPSRAAVNVIGLFRYTSGLQYAVKSTVESLTSVGVRTGLRDVPVVFRREPREKQTYDAIESADVTIINTGLDFTVAEAYDQSGLHARQGVHRVGIWWWELEALPAHWLDRADGVEEIWAPTRFIAHAMQRAFRKPVYTMMPGLELPAFVPLSKPYFGLDPSRFTFCFVFDMNSRMQRKNPLGLIEAFRRAFSPADAVELVIKVSAPEAFYQPLWDRLRAAVAATPNVKLVDRVLSRSEVLGLIDVSDAYISLHRSEGFGLTCAEAMLLGKPVIATNYSGNLDFMTKQNSHLVDYDLVQLQETIDPYPAAAFWAEPNRDHAAALMREVFENPAAAKTMGLRAKQDVSAHLSIVAAGERMRARLEEIRQSRGR